MRDASDHSGSEVPRALPAWITRELVEETMRVWRPYYGGDLTFAQAVQILLATSRLFGVLSEPHPDRRDRP